MAARRDSRGRFVRSSSGTRTRTIVRTSRPSGGPIVVRATTSPTRRRGGGGRSGGGASSGERVRKAAAIGGVILGYVKKNHAAATINKLPAIKGSHMATLAIGLHFLRPKPGGIVDHVATASAAIAAYEIGQGLGDDGGGAEW